MSISSFLVIKNWKIALSGSVGLLFASIEKYVFNDWDFLGFLMILILADSILGGAYAWKTHKFSLSIFGKTLATKIGLYFLALIVIHAAAGATSNLEGSIMRLIVPYFEGTIYTFFVIQELVSLARSFSKFGFNVLPKFVLKRFEDFDEQGIYVGKPNEARQHA
jgi:phage-related holin